MGDSTWYQGPSGEPSGVYSHMRPAVREVWEVVKTGVILAVLILSVWLVLIATMGVNVYSIILAVTSAALIRHAVGRGNGR